MNRILAWLCVVGGLLWGAKPIYDGLIIGRKLNTGYIPEDPTDYVKFIFPFLCLSGLMIIHSLYKKKVRIAVILLSAAVIFSGLFHFFEIYFYDSGLPFGFVFLFFATIGMAVGSIFLFLPLRKMGSNTSLLTWCTLVLFLDNFLLLILAFMTEILPIEITNPIMVVLMVSVGFIWASIGLALLNQVDPVESQSTK